MDILRFLVIVVIIVGGIAIVGWLLRKFKITIPYPVMVVLYCALAILCLFVLASLVGFGPWGVRW